MRCYIILIDFVMQYTTYYPIEAYIFIILLITQLEIHTTVHIIY